MQPSNLPSGTVRERMDLTRGRTRGFDYLRGALSIAVIGFHSVLTCYGLAPSLALAGGPWRPLIAFILPSFFALSGFLVAGSMMRSKSIEEFLTLRVVRLAPALFCEVLISAMILGPLLTEFSLHDYFAAPEFRSYWLNTVGDIHYALPGLFLHNPDPGMVNRQLWTIPVELKCYGLIAALYLIGGKRRPWIILPILIVCLVGFPLRDAMKGLDLSSFGNVPDKVLLLSFLCGIAGYVFGHRIRLSGWLFALSVAACGACLHFRYGAYLAPIPVTYVTVYLGLSNPPASVLSRTGDVSYGLYIYGYVVQQAYAWLFPGFLVWWANILFTLVVASLAAVASFRLIERPVGRQRDRILWAVDRTIGAGRRQLMRLRPV